MNIIKTEKIKINRLLLKFIFSYLALICATLLIALYIYNVSFKMLNNSIHTDTNIYINNAINHINQEMKEIEKIMTKLSLNDDITHYAFHDNPQNDIHSLTPLRMLSKNLSSYEITDTYIEGTYIFFQKSNVLLSNITIYLDADNFFKNQIILKDMNGKHWDKDLLKRRYTSTVYFPGQIEENEKIKPVLICMRTIYSPRELDKSVTAMIIVKDDLFQQSLNIISKMHGYSNVYTKDGLLLSSTKSMEPSLGKDEREMFFEVRSNYNEWIYHTYIPYKVAFAPLLAIKQNIFMVTVIVLLICLALTLYQSSKFTSPIQRILHVLKKASMSIDEKNDFQHIESSVSTLVSINYDLREKLDQQHALTRESLLDMILTNRLTTQKSNEQLMSLFNIHLKSPVAVAIIHTNFYPPSNTINQNTMDTLAATILFLGQQLDSYDNNTVYYKTLGVHDLVILLSVKEKKLYKKEMSDLITYLNEITQPYKNIHLNYSIGHCVSKYTNTFLSYQYALEAMEYSNTHPEQSIIWYDDIPIQQHTFYYPIEEEQQLINVIKSGDAAHARQLIQYIFFINLAERSLSQLESQYFLSALQGTIQRIYRYIVTQEYTLPYTAIEQIDAMRLTDVPEEFQKNMLYLIQLFCSIISESRTQKDHQLKLDLLSYVDEHYADNQLCLTLLSGQFNITETYASQVFKEQANENFSVYIEKKRITKACELLKQKDTNIRTISELVGYNSSHSFRRVFKKHMLITPSDYMNQ